MKQDGKMKRHSSRIAKKQRTLHYPQRERERERDLQRIPQSKERPASKAQTKSREYLDSQLLHDRRLSKLKLHHLDYRKSKCIPCKNVKEIQHKLENTK
jgi:hypothetical protein